MKKRFLSCLMALALCLTLLPTAALAEETEGTAQTPPAVEEAAEPANGEAKQENQPAETKQESQPAEQEEQQEDPAAKQAVADVQAMIDALPDAEALDGMDDEDAMAVYEAFQTACDAYYDTLTEEQQAQLKNTEKLAALSDWFNAQVAPLAWSGNISPDTVDADGKIIRRTDGWSRNGPIYEGSQDDADFTDGQSYVVQGSNVTIHGNLTVGGIGTLILCQGAKLTVEGALICNGNYSIYGQSDKGNNAGRLVIENSKGGGAAIRSSENGAPTLSIYSGELEIHSGNSDKLVDGVKLSSTNHIHQGTLDGTAVSPEVWGADSLEGGTLTLAYCQHEHDADQKLIPDNSGTTHHWHCKACGFDWASEACYFGNPDHYVPNPKDKANTHFPVCKCGNVSTTPAKHEPTAIPTDDGKGHTQRCMYCLYTPTENNPVEEHHYKADGECENCGFKPVACDDAGDLYESVNAALRAAADGGTVTLEAHTDSKELREEVVFDRADKSVTLEMNGYTLTNEGGPVITVEAGTLTVSGDAVINQTGEIYPDQVNSAVVVSGGKVIFEGKLTAQGGLYGSSGNARTCAPAVYADGGELELNGDLNLNGGLTVTGSAALTKGLSQGTFRVEYLKSDGTTKETVTGSSVSVEGSTNYTNINSLLAANHSFFDTEKKGYLGVSYKSWSGNVIIEAHEHTWAKPESGDSYECTVCGQVCAHEGGYKTGKCEVCGKPCPHALADQSPADHKYYCNDCGQQMFVRIQTDTYKWAHYTTLKEALEAAANGQTVTLLADIEWGVTPQSRAEITGDGKIVTLDLNGHTITGGWIDIGDNNKPTSCTLKIIGEGGHESLDGAGGYSGVSPKATLDLSEWEGGTISSINISDDSRYEAETREAAVIVGPKAGTIGKLAFGNNQLPKITKTKLSGGKFNEIWVAGFGPVKLGELLADGYAFQNGDGSYVEYGRTLQGVSIYNVKVVKCPHADAKDGTCLYCNQDGILARVGDMTYGSVSDAVAAWMNVGGTLKLYADYGQGADGNALDLSSASAEWLTIDLNGHGFYKDCQDDINLSGGKSLTITDSKEKTSEQGAFGHIDADRGTLTLESGHLQGLRVPSSSTATILLKGGKLTGISCPVPIFNLLPDGYALMDDSGLPVDPTITIDDSKTYTVKDSTNLHIGSQKEGSAAIGSDTIPFALSLKTADSEIGQMGFTWYIVKEDGTTQKLAASTSDVTPGTNGVYTCDAANMTVDLNGWTDLIVGKTYNVLCVVSGKAPDGAYRWQTPMRGFTLQTLPPSLENAEIRFAAGWQERTFWPDRDNHSVGKTEIPSGMGAYTVTLNGKKLTEDRDYRVISGNVATGIGTYDLTIEGIAPNYSGTKTAQWTVVPRPLGTFKISPTKKQYDGTAALPDGAFPGKFFPMDPSLPDITLREGTDYVVTDARFDTPDASNENKVYRYTVELKNPNYVFANGTKVQTWVYGVDVNATIEITKADAPTAREGALEVINNHADTYTVDLSALLPKLESPRTYGEITYGQPAVQLDSGYYTVGNAKVENGKLILTIDKNPVTTTGSIGTVTVNVSTTNYHDFDLTINVNATNKIVPTGTPTLSKTTLAWGEQLSTITLSGTMKDGDTEVKGTFAWTSPETTPDSMSDFAAEWKFTPENTDVYAEITDAVTITVTKATPTGAPKYTAINASGKTLADALLTVNEAWPEGTVQWVDENGVELDVSTEVKANTAYKWVFTPKDTEHYNELTGSITLYSVSGSSGGGGGSSSDRDSHDSNSVIKTETKNNADGSTTKTETKKDGTVIETTTGKDGSVSKTETKPDGSSVTENKAADGSTGTVKTDKNGQTEAKTALSGKAIEDAKKNGEAVKAPVEVQATKNSSTAPVVKVNLPRNSGETKVEIPVSNVKPGTVAVLVHPDGTEEILKDSIPTEDGIQLTVNDGATVKIVDNSKDFADTRDHWAKDEIDFVSARGLVNGMSATIYAPNNSTTRAQLWTILARQNDTDLSGGANWYEKAQLWSKDKGISDGTNPNGTINRAQMVTMLWRTMGQPAATDKVSFADVPAGSYYAQAVAWAVESGITTGVGSGKFNPTGTCTRAQIAAFLARSMK